MKIVGFFLVVVIIHQLIAAIEAQQNSDDYNNNYAVTTVGTVNTTFGWQIKNFNLLKWQLIHSPKTVFGPFFKSKYGTKINCSIIPMIDEETKASFQIAISQREIYTSIPKIICDFNPEPMTVEYFYFGKENEKYYGAEIQPGHIKDHLKIFIRAFYSPTLYGISNFDDMLDF